jgi:Ala-tRNA(Pro) deacylase
MGIARRLQWYLDHHDADYELVRHAHSRSSLDTAMRAGVPVDLVAKSVLLEDERGYLMAVLPASRRVDIHALRSETCRKLGLAEEKELGSIFEDCEIGAVPPMGAAYGIPMVVDDTVLEAPDIYFEAGDHEALVHMRGSDFRSLVRDAPHGRFSTA